MDQSAPALQIPLCATLPLQGEAISVNWASLESRDIDGQSQDSK
jgi:hypothetical protein